MGRLDLVPPDVLVCVVELLGRLELELFKCTCRSARAAVRQVELAAPRPERPVRVCDLAAEAGHLQLLQWLQQQGCPIDQSARAAAHAGQLHVLEWMVQAGAPSLRLEDVMVPAASQGHVHVLEWLTDSCPSCAGVCWKKLRRDAISSGEWRVVCWIDTVRPMCRTPWPDPVCYAAVLAAAVVYTGAVWLVAEAWPLREGSPFSGVRWDRWRGCV